MDKILPQTDKADMVDLCNDGQPRKSGIGLFV